ncbi:hypothetical protein Adu01nite_73790 [Paractinoplanes durhamensis]|uniref:VOC domain-containing protein n=2 Tax=Paractinoplanes durhamensis TaxID=113563 RepID=A0ABQ3Z920_9ACTN|nr:hypothetical protein Adu01nite_73790 [Actinoplanes durhamensis]
MANQTGRPIAPARKLVAAVMGTIAVFVVALGLGMSSWGVVVFGLAVLALSIALGMVNVVRRGARAWVTGTAEVRVISPPPTSSAVYGRAEIQAVVVAPGLPTSEVTLREPRVPVVKWPMIGDTLPITVDVDDMRRVRINWDEASPHERGADPPPPPPGPYDDIPDDLDTDLLGDPEPPPWASRDRQWSPADEPPPPPPAAGSGGGTETVVVRHTPEGTILEGELVDHDETPQPLPRRAPGATTGAAATAGAAAGAAAAAATSRPSGGRPSPHRRGGTATATAEPETAPTAAAAAPLVGDEPTGPPQQRTASRSDVRPDPAVHDDDRPVDVPLDEPTDRLLDQPLDQPVDVPLDEPAPEPRRRPEPTVTSTTATPSPTSAFPTAPEPVTAPPVAPEPSTVHPATPHPEAPHAAASHGAAPHAAAPHAAAPHAAAPHAAAPHAAGSAPTAPSFDEFDLPLDGDPDPAPERTDPAARDAMAEGLIAPPVEEPRRPAHAPPVEVQPVEVQPQPVYTPPPAADIVDSSDRPTTQFMTNAAHDKESAAAAGPARPAEGKPGVVSGAAAVVGAAAASVFAAVKKVGHSDKHESAPPPTSTPTASAPAASARVTDPTPGSSAPVAAPAPAPATAAAVPDPAPTGTKPVAAASVPVVSPTPEPVAAAAAPKTVASPAPEPVVAAAPEPVVAAAPEPVVAAAPEPVAAAAPKTVVSPAPEPVVAAAPKPVSVAPTAGTDTPDVGPWAAPLGTEPDAHADDLITGYPSARPGPAGAIYGVGITVLVTDLARSIAFYRDTLGFYEIDNGDGSAVLASGDTRLVLRTVTGLSAEAGRLIYLNLEVGDVEAVYAELIAKGVKFLHAPQAVNRGDRLELWSATFRDPDDHNIAITQWRAIR